MSLAYIFYPRVRCVCSRHTPHYSLYVELPTRLPAGTPRRLRVKTECRSRVALANTRCSTRILIYKSCVQSMFTTRVSAATDAQFSINFHDESL